MLSPRVAVALACLLTAGALAGCDSSTSSGASSEPSSGSSPSSSATTTAPAPTASASSDPASQALCAAVSNAVGAGTTWQLAEPVPQTRVVGGVPVAACDVAEQAGDPKTQLSVAFLPAGGSLDGAGLLAGLCKAVIHVTAKAGARSCAVKPGRPGRALGRADLMTGDGGVLVMSFDTAQPAYAPKAADGLATVGTTLAGDPLLARAIGVAPQSSP